MAISHSEEWFSCHHGHEWSIATTTISGGGDAPETTYDVPEDEVHCCPTCGELDATYLDIDKYAISITNELYAIFTGNQTLADKCQAMLDQGSSRFKLGMEGIMSMDEAVSYEALAVLRDIFSAVALLAKREKVAA